MQTDREDAHCHSGSAERQGGRLDGARYQTNKTEKRNRNVQLTEQDLGLYMLLQHMSMQLPEHGTADPLAPGRSAKAMGRITGIEYA